MAKTFGLLLIVAAAWFIVESYVNGSGPGVPEHDGERATPAQRAGASVERSMERSERRYDSQLGD